MSSLSELLESAGKLDHISADAASEYAGKSEILLDYINEKLLKLPDLAELTGKGNIDVLMDNNSNHVKFMSNVFAFNNFLLLAKTLPWVYRTYTSRNFRKDFFIKVMQLWIEAVDTIMDSSGKKEIISIYKWMINEDTNIFELSSSALIEIPEIPAGMKNLEERYLSCLIQGDDFSASELAINSVSTSKELSAFYINVIQPAMTRIGLMWEKNEITVAHEHLASSITARVISQLYQKITPHKISKGKAIVTSAPNEFHNLGGRMIADLLEVNGWDIQYLGSNTPASDLIMFAKNIKPVFIAVSVSMAFNLIRVRQLIENIRKELGTESPVIIVGGRIFLEHPELENTLGADYCITDIDKAEQIVSGL